MILVSKVTNEALPVRLTSLKNSGNVRAAGAPAGSQILAEYAVANTLDEKGAAAGTEGAFRAVAG
jgi:hypothetical protein